MKKDDIRSMAVVFSGESLPSHHILLCLIVGHSRQPALEEAKSGEALRAERDSAQQYLSYNNF